MDEPKIFKPTPEELKTILENHRKWRNSEDGGARADLAGADLAGANLDGANLDGADLARANLDGADLAGANLARANLDGANLDGADLAGANLARANLAGADLARANLAGVRDDFYKVLNYAPLEVPALLAALREGRVDGSTYGDGGCACLVGTIANARGVTIDGIPGLVPDGSRPAERWFLAIKEGDTPANNQVAAIVERWINDWKPPVVEAKPAEPAALAVSE